MEAAKETVSNLITAASNMVYGETTQSDTTTTTNTTDNKDSLLGDSTNTSTGNTTGGIEPVSGQSGPGTADKPHDTGNTTGKHSVFHTLQVTLGQPQTGEPSNTTGSSSTTTGSTDPTDTTSTSKSSATATTAQDVGTAPPESGAAPTTKQQGADKPNDAPDSTESAAISNKKEAAEDAMGEGEGTSTSAGSSDPTNSATSGSSGPSSNTPGPKPLGADSSKSGGGQDDALGSVSDEKGTGEKYIKSSGVKADGGDFDASAAGAGREADRLLEEKGIHREAGNTGPPQEIPGDTKGSAAASEDKVSFGQKLKDKLHIKNKDKP